MSSIQHAPHGREVNLPRLLYVGDVEVESTLAGSAVLYRLLQKYPATSIRIAESNLRRSNSKKRLPDVKYYKFNSGRRRILHTRLNSAYSAVLFLTATFWTRYLNPIVEEFMPEAILTVAHGYSWLTAAKLAEQHNLPLHLILHDDYLHTINLPGFMKVYAEKRFGEIYKKSQNRFCVSPHMAKVYYEKYGVTGTVLYPSRAVDGFAFDRPPGLKEQSKKPFVFAYAGSINSQAYATALGSLASILDSVNGKLIIFSPLTQDDLSSLGLSRENLIVYPIVSSSEMSRRVREEADALFVPMAFDEKLIANMKMGFPSKLADFTAIGLPILIWGPPSCSAVTWARDNAGVAEVVDENSIAALSKAVFKLINNPQHCVALGANALAKGLEHFSHEAIIKIFYQSISWQQAY